MNTLIIGSGGREHCLAWKLSQCGKTDKVFAIPGNPGMSDIAECKNISIDSKAFPDILKFVCENKIDFTIVGPEAPLVEGIVDYFKAGKHKIFGPDRSASRLEGSKVFTKDLCRKYKIPTAQSIKFERNDYSKAKNYINKLKNRHFPVVIKVDGLAAGKGVIIADSKTFALQTLKDCFIDDIFGNASDSIIIEQYISGFEVSILNLCDGKDIVPLVLAQDYKKIFDDDAGKNTGGMGSYSPVPFVDDALYQKILNEIIYPSYEAILSEGINYKGILYGGIIINNDGPFLLEYNCRFGDPETQAIIPRLKSDLLEVLMACERGNISNYSIKWDDLKCVCVVLASKGYPESSSKGDMIKGLESLKGDNADSDILVFHAGTKKESGSFYTNGGRVLGVVSKSGTFKDARQKVYEGISKIYFDGMQYRKDIALKVEEK